MKFCDFPSVNIRTRYTISTIYRVEKLKWKQKWPRSVIRNGPKLESVERSELKYSSYNSRSPRQTMQHIKIALFSFIAFVYSLLNCVLCEIIYFIISLDVNRQLIFALEVGSLRLGQKSPTFNVRK